MPTVIGGISHIRRIRRTANRWYQLLKRAGSRLLVREGP
jgi:hypothetical protein